MIRKIKRNYKLGIAFILGIIVSGVVVYAATIESKNVSYDNSKSGISATTMQGALDELYEKTKTQCKVVEGNKTTVGSTVNCGGEIFYISTTGSTITLIAKYGLNSSYQQSTTPTPVNYSDATNWIENYVNITLSWLKGNIISYEMPEELEIVKLATGKVYNDMYYAGEKLGIGGSTSDNFKGYWIASKTIFTYIPGPNGYNNMSLASDDTTEYGFGNLKGYTYARIMIQLPSSIISNL